MSVFSIQNRRYLGNKHRLTPFIDQVISDNCHNCYRFFDVFSGTGTVAHHLSDRYQVITNDFLIHNAIAHYAFLADQPFDSDKIEGIIQAYNQFNPDELPIGYFTQNFINTYLDGNSLKKIDFIRDDIDRLIDVGIINTKEWAILITSLLYGIDKIANTVGHYDAYRKDIELNKPLILRPLQLNPISFSHQIYNTDSNLLACYIKSDIAYLDPPYNSRQYGNLYHFLDNVAMNTKPLVIGVAKKPKNESLKSAYSSNHADFALTELINRLDTKYILLSYNSTANSLNARSNAKISDDKILSILENKGNTVVFEQEYKPFSTGKSNQKILTERLFLCTIR